MNKFCVRFNMWRKAKKRNIFPAKKYKIERTRIYYQKPWRFKKGIFKLNLINAINIILSAVILICIYFLIFSNFYNITNVEVYGNQIISIDDVLDLTNNYLAQNKFFIFRNRNIFLLNRNELTKKINEVVLLDNIKIEKILPNKIIIKIKERDAALKWLTKENEFLVDKQGQIIKKYYKTTIPKIFQIIESPETSGEKGEDNFLKIRDASGEYVNLGDKVFTPENIEFILNLIFKLNEKDYLKVKNILVPNKLPQYLTIVLENGSQIYFNLADSLDSQLNRLNLIIEQKIKRGNLNLVDYIDLRLGESVYYKMK